MNGPNYTQGYYWYFATKEDAMNWPIAPGNMLVFMDPDGTKFYTKTLGWAPYEKIVFKEFGETNPIPEQKPAAVPEASSNLTGGLEEEIKGMKSQISELFDLIKRENIRWQNNNKKGDNK